jgi:hypothetical protein
MATYGVDWTAEQNRIIVEAYFQMLQMQQSGEPYVRGTKTQYKRCVQEQTGKTDGAVESKLCNISFLLQEMDHPIITGYPRSSNAVLNE